jgi:hypothetical protein
VDIQTDVCGDLLGSMRWWRNILPWRSLHSKDLQPRYSNQVQV